MWAPIFQTPDKANALNKLSTFEYISFVQNCKKRYVQRLLDVLPVYICVAIRQLRSIYIIFSDIFNVHI